MKYWETGDIYTMVHACNIYMNVPMYLVAQNLHGPSFTTPNNYLRQMFTFVNSVFCIWLRNCQQSKYNWFYTLFLKFFYVDHTNLGHLLTTIYGLYKLKLCINHWQIWFSIACPITFNFHLCCAIFSFVQKGHKIKTKQAN